MKYLMQKSESLCNLEEQEKSRQVYYPNNSYQQSAVIEESKESSVVDIDPIDSEEIKDVNNSRIESLRRQALEV